MTNKNRKVEIHGDRAVAMFVNHDDTVTTIDMYNDTSTKLFSKGMMIVKRYIFREGIGASLIEKLRLKTAIGPKTNKKKFKRNGLTIEDLLYGALLRIMILNEKSASKDNMKAINYIKKAIDALDDRRLDRKRRGVLNTTKE